MNYQNIIWRKIDHPGHEFCQLTDFNQFIKLNGVSIMDYLGYPCQLEYEIRCSRDWITKSVVVTGYIDNYHIQVRIERNGNQWRLNNELMPHLDDCVDIDLGFSPATNTLPIRRLGLQPGEKAKLKVAWLTFPEFSLKEMTQEYTCLDMHTYQYESRNGRFTRKISIDESGFVVSYPGFWEVEGGKAQTDYTSKSNLTK